MNNAVLIGILFIVVIVTCLVLLILDLRKERQVKKERDALWEILAEMVNDQPPVRRLPPLRPPTPSMGIPPREEIAYLKEAIEQRRSTRRPAPPKPGRVA